MRNFYVGKKLGKSEWFIFDSENHEAMFGGRGFLSAGLSKDGLTANVTQLGGEVGIIDLATGEFTETQK